MTWFNAPWQTSKGEWAAPLRTTAGRDANGFITA